MANTYSKIYIHFVLVVKYRAPLIQKSWRDDLCKYMSGIISAKNQKLYAIGGVEDHLHVLISIEPTLTICDLVRDLKACSTKWINERGVIKQKFQWQAGYAAFSCDYTRKKQVINYILNQEEHHKKKKIKAELVHLLDRYEVDWDEKYLFDGEPHATINKHKTQHVPPLQGG